MYIDESGFAIDSPRTHGYAQRGQPVLGYRNWHEKGRQNVIGALYNGRLINTCIFNCTINADVVYAWLTQELFPSLPPNAVLIMDNASFHLRLDIKEAILNHHFHLLFLPSYSPGLNPIEHTWAHYKAFRKKHRCSVSDTFKNYDKL